ncbi:MAG: type I methionyl aminopeptidase [Streptosporangiales bacterium]|nr:type I methionyl aminopeptidase [Streptosporangiales bacterium]
MLRRGKSEFQIKSDAEIAKMREAGLVVAETLEKLRAAVEPGITTADLDAIAERHIRDAGAVPSFKGYHGFPATICASVNEEIVHGIPRPDKELREGDLVSIDCGAILDGWHGDSAVTVGVGEIDDEARALLSVCEEAMWRGIAAIRQDNRLGDIGHAVDGYICSRGTYGNVREYGGHGIGTEMHQDPHVPNFGKPGKGPKLVTGLCLAIEPMVNLGGDETLLLADDWTVITADRSRSAHFEHSVALTADGPYVLTAFDGGKDRLARFSAGATAGGS